MSKLNEPYFQAAECFRDCDDPTCPYTHTSEWCVDDLGMFSTREEALEVLRRAKENADAE